METFENKSGSRLKEDTSNRFQNFASSNNQFSFLDQGPGQPSMRDDDPFAMNFDARPLPGDMDLDFPTNLNLEKNLSYPFIVPEKPESITGKPAEQVEEPEGTDNKNE